MRLKDFRQNDEIIVNELFRHFIVLQNVHDEGLISVVNLVFGQTDNTYLDIDN